MSKPDLTDEQRTALDHHGGILQGPSFVLLRTDVFQKLLGFHSDQELRQQLQIGFDQAADGQWRDWDPARIKNEGRRRLQQRSDAK